MQQKKSSSKGTIITMTIIIIIALGLYFYYKGTPEKDPLSSLDAVDTENLEDANLMGSRVLTLLNQINALKIDGSIFESTVYKSLVDYTITIPEQPVGRANPFAPIR